MEKFKELVKKAKQKRLNVTAGVCPHHLFMTVKDREKKGALAIMKPPLGTHCSGGFPRPIP